MISHPSSSDMDSMHVGGTLPGAHERYAVKVKLDPESHEITKFWIRAGSKKYRLSRGELSAYRRVDLGTLKIEDTFSIAPDPDKGHQNVWSSLTISFEYGRLQTTYRCPRGMPEAVRGRDRLLIAVSKGQRVSISAEKFGDEFLADLCKERILDVPPPAIGHPSDSL